MKKSRPEEYYSNGLFEISRYGNIVSAVNNMTESQYAKYLEGLANSYNDLVDEINSLVYRIRSLVQNIEPSNLLNYILSMNMMCSLNKVSEADYPSELNAQLRSLEYIQSVIVSSPNYYDDNSEVDESQLAETLNLTTNLYTKIQEFYLLWSAKAKTENSLTDDELSYSVISQTMFLVRGKQYQCFRLDILRELIAPHSEIIRQIYGISIDVLMKGLTALEHNLSTGRLDAMQKLRELIDQTPEHLDCVTKDYKNNAQEVVNQLIGLDLHDVKKHTEWPDRLIEDLSLSINSDYAFFNHESFNGWPIWDLPINRKPFITLYGKNYCFDYYTLFDNFYRSLQKAVFSYGKEYQEKWKIIQTETSEETVSKLFSKLLPGCIVHRSNHYNIPSGSAENDLIILYKDVLFIIEVKAGSFTYTPAFLDLNAHKESLKILINKAEKQCIRTRDYIISCSEAKFYSDDALKEYSFTINSHDYSQIYMLDITVDSINEIASSIEKIQIANAQEDIISISIDDLWVYSDYFDNPAQFIHFMKQRLAATRSKEVNLYDELDHLGLYISYNMYTLQAQAIGQGNSVHFEGYRKELDHFYACKQLNIEVEKPRQLIPELINQIIGIALERSSIESPFHFTNFLLDFSTDSRESLCDLVSRLISREKETGNLIPGMCFGEASYCILVMLPEVTNTSFNEVDYVEANLLNSGRDNCYLIKLKINSLDKICDLDVRLFNRSSINPERIDILKAYGDEIVKNRIGMRSIYGSKVKTGRNEQCPCGSGKRYKNCCGKRRIVP